MGAKTGLLAFSDGDVRPLLRRAARPDPAGVEALVRRVHPDHAVEPGEEGALAYSTYPPDDVTYATVLPGAEVLCSRRFMLDHPSELPEHLLTLGEGRRIITHSMHSVVDWLAFSVWEDGALVRSLSLSPDSGVMEDIGEPLPFELPYWAGEHPVEPDPAWDDGEPYPLPFHPLDMGEDALRALFGFILEGAPENDDIDASTVPVRGFRVFDPTGEEQAAREAEMAKAMESMGPPRVFTLGPDGTWQEDDRLLDG
ncbi:hypothetical protein GCM10009678_86140 [Actinomadura kijaniata]|uniref:Uncharacterized protein n=1 Tax=Actinomadura namibiensis TaxID=182080 RepID=A0A7W3LJP7_ACTNM|nr:hypothetical protein [Actinomadura namibiensis]MBA8949402.1 hypothetical protein [Actinomadura namibiensis]